MRRTLVTVSIFGAFLASVYWLKDRVHFAPNIGTPPLPVQKNFTTKGAKHDETRNQRSRSAKVQRPRTRQDEGASIELDEIESIASIYQDQEVVEQRASVTEEELNSQAENHTPIPGVKVSAWVSSQKHAVPKDVPDPNVGTGMRYFLNCMEVKKKKLSPLEAKDCDALITDRRYKN